MKHRLVLRFSGVLVALCLQAGCGGERILPDVEGIHLDGKPFRTSQVRGHDAWFEFWAPWDPASRQRMRDLVEIVERHPDWPRRLRIITVAVNSEPADVRKALPATAGDLFEVVVETGDLAQSIGVATVPATLLVDAQGRYRHLREGYVEAPVLEQAVEALISGTSGTPGE